MNANTKQNTDAVICGTVWARFHADESHAAILRLTNGDEPLTFEQLQALGDAEEKIRRALALLCLAARALHKFDEITHELNA